jgi:hypothetical protein
MPCLEEPDARIAHVRICGGPGRQRSGANRPPNKTRPSSDRPTCVFEVSFGKTEAPPRKPISETNTCRCGRTMSRICPKLSRRPAHDPSAQLRRERCFVRAAQTLRAPFEEERSPRSNQRGRGLAREGLRCTQKRLGDGSYWKASRPDSSTDRHTNAESASDTVATNIAGPRIVDSL